MRQRRQGGASSSDDGVAALDGWEPPDVQVQQASVDGPMQELLGVSHAPLPATPRSDAPPGKFSRHDPQFGMLRSTNVRNLWHSVGREGQGVGLDGSSQCQVAFPGTPKALDPIRIAQLHLPHFRRSQRLPDAASERIFHFCGAENEGKEVKCPVLDENNMK
jgi:hypothetical protein